MSPLHTTGQTQSKEGSLRALNAFDASAHYNSYVKLGVDSGDLRRFEALDRPDIDRAYRSEASGIRDLSALHSYWAAGSLATTSSTITSGRALMHNPLNPRDFCIKCCF